MADRLGTSSAYLSAVETGRKPVPPTMPEEIASKFELDDATTRRLCAAATECVKTVHLNVANRSQQAQELAVAFARRFPKMNEIEVNRLMTVLLTPGQTSAPRKAK